MPHAEGQTPCQQPSGPAPTDPPRKDAGLVLMLRRAAEFIGVSLFALLFGVFVIQIVARFLLGRPLPWTDEAAVVLYIWAMLWSAALICREREHVAFDLLYTGRTSRGQRGMALLAAVLVGGLCAWALPGVVDYILFMRRESTPVLGWPMHWVYAPFALLMLALVLRSLQRIWQLLGRRWQQVLEQDA